MGNGSRHINPWVGGIGSVRYFQAQRNMIKKKVRKKVLKRKVKRRKRR